MGTVPIVGAFEVIAQVAAGGMGTIWRARHVTDRDLVAIKFVTAAYAEHARYRDGFRREVEAVAGLSHIGIVGVYDYGEVGELAASVSQGELVAGMPWLAMEYADLGNLDHVVVESWGELRVVLYDVLDALAHAHSRGIIHRDLKPANILVTQTADDELLLKLSDFGIAHLARDGREDTNEIFGTPTYMAPEQFSGRVREHGPWTDLYALGVMTYELLTGSPPFEHTGVFALAQAHLRDAVPPVDADFDVPWGLTEWVMRLLMKEPRQRFAHAADARWALQQLDPLTEKSPIRMRLTDLPEAAFTVRSDWASARTLPLVLHEDADPEVAFVPPTADFVQRPIPAHWHVADSAARTRALLSGVGLGLFGLRPVPFVGRQHERDVIWQALRAADRDSRTRAVIVRGEAGCGKSRLAEWITQRALELGAAEVVVARHDSMDPGTGQLAGALADAFRLPDRDRVAAHALLSSWLGPDAASAVSALITGDGSAYSGIDAVDFGGDRERYAAALELLQHVGRRRPVVVWIDDAQWGADMVAFANHVLRAASPTAILFLCTVRTGEEAQQIAALDDLAANELSTVIDLAPLDRDARRQQIQRMLHLPDEVVTRVVARSEGNPLFAVQLVGDWVERGVLVRGERGFELNHDDAAIPDNIHALWLQRVSELENRFGVSAPQCLRVAAAVGDEVGDHMWRLCCEARGLEIPTGLLQAMVTRRLAQRTDRGFRFVHRMFRESLERDARETGAWTRDNGACAAILDLLHPEPGPAERSRMALYLLASGAPREALEHLIAASRTLISREDLTELEVTLRLTNDALEAAGYGPTDEPTGTVRQLELKLYRLRGQFSLSDPLTKELLDDAREHDWRTVEATALFDAGASVALSNAHEGRQMLFEAVDLFEPGEQERQRALAFKHLSHVYALHGNSLLAGQCAEDAFKLFTALRDAGQKAWCLYYLGLGRRVAGALKDAERRLLDALSLAEEAGLRDLQANCQNVLADLWRMEGDLDRACEGYERAEQIWRAIGSANVAAAQFNLGMSELQRGAFGAARARLEALRAEFERNQQKIPLAATHVALLACAAEADDAVAAAVHLAEGRKLLTATGLVDPDVLVALQTAMTWFARNNRPQLQAETALLAEDQSAAMT